MASEALLEGLRVDKVLGQTFCRALHSSSSSKSTSTPKLRRKTKTERAVAHSDTRSSLASGRNISKEPNAYRTTSQGAKRPPLSPTLSLALWLDAKSDEERLSVWNTLNGMDSRWWSTLPAILLQYMHQLNVDGTAQMVDARDLLRQPALKALEKSGFSIDDVYLWASITTASTGDEAARQYLASSQVKPNFVLLEVLRRRRLSAQSFRSLLLHSWDHCLRVNSNSLPPQLHGEAGRQPELNMESLSFMILIRRLCRHSRQVLAPAVTSISHMFINYWNQISADRVSPDDLLSSKLHSRISKAYNMLIRILASPASAAPMLSMHHNWDAQRLLLESAGQFSPPLLLDQPSYRGVTRVLLALKKSEGEEKYAGLLHRSWPPWRKDQDGMDVERSPEDDISRAVSAGIRMKEAGYTEEDMDRAIRVLGGRESDGTPTIPTRSLVGVKRRDIRLKGLKVKGFTDGAIKLRGTIDESAARIMATRDAREAWAAFLSLSELHGRPTYSMYPPMFEKLIYHAKAGGQIGDSEIVPGTLKEPIPLPDDNMSESERLRTQPPDFWSLYAQMIRERVIPAGRFLEMLIANATNSDEVRIYLRDSGMNEKDANLLTRGSHGTDIRDLERIPPRIIMSFIKFLSKRARFSKFTNSEKHPMIFAFDLVRHFKFRSPVALYDLIIGLSHPQLYISDRVASRRECMTRWGLITASLRDFHRYGGDHHPFGLQVVCRALETTLPAFDIHHTTVPAPNRSGLLVVKEMFQRLSISAEPIHGLPALFHKLGGSHLHAYVRVLCLSHDTDEIISLLQWMVQHQKELVSTAEQARNGGVLLRRTLVAIRAILEQNYTHDVTRMHEMEDLVNRLDGWGGWPSDHEVVEYLDHSLDNHLGGAARQEQEWVGSTNGNIHVM